MGSERTAWVGPWGSRGVVCACGLDGDHATLGCQAPATGRASQLDLSGGLEVKINGQGLSSPRVCTSAYEVS